MPTELETSAEVDSYINEISGIEPETNTNDQNQNADDQNNDKSQGDDFRNDQQQVNDKNVDKSAQDQVAAKDGRTQPQDKNTKGKQPDKGKKTPDANELKPLGDGVYADKEGNLVTREGKLIAERGFAARMHQENRRLKSIVDTRTQELNSIQRAVGEVKALATSIQGYGLDNSEVAQALDLAGRMKRGDVLGVAKEVIALCAAQGYNVTDLLGKEVGDTIDMRAVSRMLDERLGPITRQEQDRQQTTEAQRRGMENYQRFIADNEFAEVQADAIAKVMKQQNVPAQTAYNRVMQFITANRFDPSRPLAEQIIEHVERNRGNHEQPDNRNQQQQKPMPNGAATRTNGVSSTQPMANADDDWGSIIRSVQQTLGVH